MRHDFLWRAGRLPRQLATYPVLQRDEFPIHKSARGSRTVPIDSYQSSSCVGMLLKVRVWLLFEILLEHRAALRSIDRGNRVGERNRIRSGAHGFGDRTSSLAALCSHRNRTLLEIGRVRIIRLRIISQGFSSPARSARRRSARPPAFQRQKRNGRSACR